MTASRERFELWLFEARLSEMNGYVKGVLHKLYGDVFDTYRPNDVLQTQFDGEKLNVTVIPREQLYRDFSEEVGTNGQPTGYLNFFNTTGESGPQLAEYQAKACEQNETVLAIFHKAAKPLSPSQVLEWWRSVPSGCGKLLPPLTSIRRAITTLTKAGALVKTEVKRKGMFGRNEFCWCLPEQAACQKSDSDIAEAPDRV